MGASLGGSPGWQGRPETRPSRGSAPLGLPHPPAPGSHRLGSVQKSLGPETGRNPTLSGGECGTARHTFLAWAAYLELPEPRAPRNPQAIARPPRPSPPIPSSPQAQLPHMESKMLVPLLFPLGPPVCTPPSLHFTRAGVPWAGTFLICLCSQVTQHQAPAWKPHSSNIDRRICVC